MPFFLLACQVFCEGTLEKIMEEVPSIKDAQERSAIFESCPTLNQGIAVVGPGMRERTSISRYC